MPDKDLERRRTGQKVDPVTGDIYTEDIYNPDRPVKEVNISVLFQFYGL
jgi:adenylate/nucleoside-diphosphate kinase